MVRAHRRGLRMVEIPGAYVRRGDKTLDRARASGLGPLLRQAPVLPEPPSARPTLEGAPRDRRRPGLPASGSSPSPSFPIGSSSSPSSGPPTCASWAPASGPAACCTTCASSTCIAAAWPASCIGRECFLGDECLLDLAEGIELEDQVTLAERVLVLTHLNVGYADHPLQAAFPAHDSTRALRAGLVRGRGRHHPGRGDGGPRGVRGRGQRGHHRRGPAHPGGGSLPRGRSAPTDGGRRGAGRTGARPGRARGRGRARFPSPGASSWATASSSETFRPTSSPFASSSCRASARASSATGTPSPTKGAPVTLLPPGLSSRPAPALAAHGGGALAGPRPPLSSGGPGRLRARAPTGSGSRRSGRRGPRLRPGRLRPLHRQPLRVRAGPGLGAVSDPLSPARRARGPARHRARPRS